jgi:flagellar hook assembly protein FlgD
LSTSVVVLPAGIEEQPTGAARFALLGSSQNPSAVNATIRYSLASSSPVDLRIFSTTAELVRTLRSGVETAGLHQVVWDRTDDLGQPVGRGTWFCRMTAGGFQAVSKLTTIE